jgi:outer membrane protein TolC
MPSLDTKKNLMSHRLITYPFVIVTIAAVSFCSGLNAQVDGIFLDPDTSSHATEGSLDAPYYSPTLKEDEQESYAAPQMLTQEYVPQASPLTTDTGWWTPMVFKPMRNSGSPIQLSLDEVLVRTLANSNQIKVFAELPMIRRTAIIEADSAFDWTRFLEGRWDDLNDPVGSSLTVGGTGTRYVNQQLTAAGGLRRRNRQGGEFELRQNLGRQETNSNFFIPNPQGTARLVLGYTQPLLRGRGLVYNESLTCLAKLDATVADDEFRRQLQAHLLEVTRAYWALYLERGVLFQKMNNFERADEIYKILERRSEVDAQEAQIVSAKASVSTRRAELIRSRTAVRNAEARLRSLVNDPALGEFSGMEIIPIDPPNLNDFNVEMEEAIGVAIQSRPEVLQALKQIKAGAIRMGMARNELLPQLNLITQAYVAGLEADSQIADAFGEQFTAGRPSYSVGLNYEVPIGNRAACARNTRRRLEYRQLQNQYQTTLATVKLEVEVAVREIETSAQELIAKKEAMVARDAQLSALTKRWQQLPGEDLSAVLALENLLTSQERLVAAENEFLQSQLTYSLAMMNLKRSTGLLLQAEGINVAEMNDGDLPALVAEKSLHQGVGQFHGVGQYDTSVPYDADATYESIVPYGGNVPYDQQAPCAECDNLSSAAALRNSTQR